jgi:uncharacterized protein (TIGR04255 family)
MATEIYTRKNIYSKMLKSVIIRCDYAEITNLEGFVNAIKPILKPYFQKMLPIEQNQYEFAITKKRDDAYLPPVAKETKKKIYRFGEYRIPDIDVKLDISSEFICFDINCEKAYQGSDVFTDLFCKLIVKLTNIDFYVYFKRIGIRKIDIQVLENGKKIEDYFNNKFIVGLNWSSNSKKKMSTMTDIIVENGINFNITQRIDFDPIIKKERLIYDVDSYIKSDFINRCLSEHQIAEKSTGEENQQIEKKLQDVLDKEMQEKMFKYFLEVVSQNYLEESKNAKEAMVQNESCR